MSAGFSEQWNKQQVDDKSLDLVSSSTPLDALIVKDPPNSSTSSCWPQTHCRLPPTGDNSNLPGVSSACLPEEGQF